MSMAAQNGMRYVKTTANVSSYSSKISVEVPFDNFVVVAEARTPKTDTNNYTSFLYFVVINGGLPATFKSGGSAMCIRTVTGGFGGASLSPHATLTNGILEFTTYSSSFLTTGTWDVVVVEIPSDTFTKLTME